MIDGVCKRLLYGAIRIVPETPRFRAIIILEYLLAQKAISDVVERRTELHVERPPERLLNHALARRIWLVHHLNPSAAEEVLRMVIEEQEPDVLRLETLNRSRCDLHVARQLGNGHLLCCRGKLAADLMQIVNDQVHLEVGDICMHVQAVIKRHVTGKVEQRLLFGSCRLDRACHLADVV